MAVEGFSDSVRRQLLRAAEEALYWETVLARSGDNVVTEVLRGVETFYQWQHYPEGDVQDPRTGAQYYYHAHPPGQRPAPEHGHFHLFVRPAQAGVAVSPLPLPDFRPPEEPEDLICHLVALAVDERGCLRELFSTNRWVTGENWYKAQDVIQLLSAFRVDHAQPSWPLNRWLESVLEAFAPDIATLLQQRDNRVLEWEDNHDGNVFEDRNLEVTSTLAVDLDSRVAALRDSLGETRAGN